MHPPSRGRSERMLSNKRPLKNGAKNLERKVKEETILRMAQPPNLNEFLGHGETSFIPSPPIVNRGQLSNIYIIGCSVYL